MTYIVKKIYIKVLTYIVSNELIRICKRNLRNYLYIIHGFCAWLGIHKIISLFTEDCIINIISL